MKKFTGITLIMLGLSLAGFVLVRSLFYAPDAEINPPPVADASLATSSAVAGRIVNTPATVSSTHLPVRLAITSIGVSASVQYVGIKSDGSMANPNNFTDVGWYKLGTVPGEPGAAVMAGHVDNALALSGVFKHLADVRPGDDIYVTRKDGVKLHFVVDRVASYPYREAPSKAIFTSPDGQAHLNLITCKGTWVQAQHSYTERLVVYTTLVD